MIGTDEGWVCMTEGCYAHGEGPGSDRQAERHGKAFGHGTHAWSRPATGAAGAPGTGAGAPATGSATGAAGGAHGPRTGAGGAGA